MPPQLKTNVPLHTTASPTAAHLNIVRTPPSAPILEDDDVALGFDVLDDEPEPVDKDALTPGVKGVALFEVVPLAVFDGFCEPDEETVVRRVEVLWNLALMLSSTAAVVAYALVGRCDLFCACKRFGHFLGYCCHSSIWWCYR